MKNSRILKMIFHFIFIIVISSCESDDNEINQTHELIGNWELIFSNEFTSDYYTIDFMPNNVGGWGKMVFYSDGTAIGVYQSFTWNTFDNPKTLIIPEMELNTPYSINDDCGY